MFWQGTQEHFQRKIDLYYRQKKPFGQSQRIKVSAQKQ